MQSDELKALLAENFADSEITVAIDGSHCNIQIVSEVFAGVSPVKKQQMVYAVINDKIADGTLHAVNIKLYTPEQWAKISA
ncbi:MAG: BolA/IbaG family iron-sulfur metabolism protein [Pseudomonadales bacterium]|nr:BolA/IbaG family iron-sulfur metabolism protein [Pseudomonadales bacterium]